MELVEGVCFLSFHRCHAYILENNVPVREQELINQINRVAELENRINLHTAHHQTNEAGRTDTKREGRHAATYHANGSDSEVDYVKQSAQVHETQGTSRSEV